MKRKWLCFALFLCLLLWPLSPLSRLEARDKLARCLAFCAQTETMESARARLLPACPQSPGQLRRALNQISLQRAPACSAAAHQAAGSLWQLWRAGRKEADRP